MMEVRTISCSKKITAVLAINVDTIEFKYSSLHTGEAFELPFTIPVGDGSNYHGKILLWKDHTKTLNCFVYDVKSLAGDVSMMISKGKVISKCGPSRDSKRIPNAKYLAPKVGDEPVTFLNGSFTITFEPMDEKLVEESLINSFSLLKQDQLESPTDVRLVVQGKEFEFNMACLAKISPMFKNWFEFRCANVSGKVSLKPCLKEALVSGDKKIQITNAVTTIQTMETFQKILVQKSVKPQEITVAMYKFANFYDIRPLVKFCGEHLGSKINKENVLEIALAADMANDEALLKKAANS